MSTDVLAKGKQVFQYSVHIPTPPEPQVVACRVADSHLFPVLLSHDEALVFGYLTIILCYSRRGDLEDTHTVERLHQPIVETLPLHWAPATALENGLPRLSGLSINLAPPPAWEVGAVPAQGRSPSESARAFPALAGLLNPRPRNLIVEMRGNLCVQVFPSVSSAVIEQPVTASEVLDLLEQFHHQAAEHLSLAIQEEIHRSVEDILSSRQLSSASEAEDDLPCHETEFIETESEPEPIELPVETSHQTSEEANVQKTNVPQVAEAATHPLPMHNQVVLAARNTVVKDIPLQRSRNSSGYSFTPKPTTSHTVGELPQMGPRVPAPPRPSPRKPKVSNPVEAIPTTNKQMATTVSPPQRPSPHKELPPTPQPVQNPVPTGRKVTPWPNLSKVTPPPPKPPGP